MSRLFFKWMEQKVGKEIKMILKFVKVKITALAVQEKAHRQKLESVDYYKGLL